MNRARSTTSVIWSTVVSAAAMLGTPACHHEAAKPPEHARTVEPAPPPPDTAPVEPAPDTAEAQVAAAPPAEPPPPPAPEVVKVQLDSTPAGAEVYRDGELLGTTPMEVELAKSDDAVTLQVKMEGYKDKDVSLKPSADQQLTFKLAKAPRVRGTGTKHTGRGFVLG